MIRFAKEGKLQFRKNEMDCQKNCPTGAAVVTDNLCTVDPEKCIGCLVCTEKCPTGAITGKRPVVKKPAAPTAPKAAETAPTPKAAETEATKPEA